VNNNWTDFKSIKETVSIRKVLDRYKVRLRKVKEGALRGPCPLPTHTSRDSWSFAADTTKNVWACQSASCSEGRGGRKGGNVLDFVAAMEGCNVREAAMRLQEWFMTDSATVNPDI
jgi:DNA primase